MAVVEPDSRIVRNTCDDVGDVFFRVEHVKPPTGSLALVGPAKIAELALDVMLCLFQRPFGDDGGDGSGDKLTSRAAGLVTHVRYRVLS